MPSPRDLGNQCRASYVFVDLPIPLDFISTESRSQVNEIEKKKKGISAIAF